MTSASDSPSFAKARNIFAERFGGTPRIFRAPGRVNLIGEHTDYNDGFALPAAIDLYTWVAIAPRDDATLHVFFRNLNQSAKSISTKKILRQGNHWSDYIHGVALMLPKFRRATSRRKISSFTAMFPPALASVLSAALEVAVANASLANSNRTLKKLARAKPLPARRKRICRRPLRNHGSVRRVFWRAGHAVLLDCRSLEGSPLPLPTELAS